jgi:hypothetical protein
MGLFTPSDVEALGATLNALLVTHNEIAATLREMLVLMRQDRGMTKTEEPEAPWQEPVPTVTFKERLARLMGQDLEPSDDMEEAWVSSLSSADYAKLEAEDVR